MTQRGEEFAKLPAEPSPRLPRGLAGGHSWVLGTPNPRPPPRRGVGGPHLSTPFPQPQLEAGCLAWVRLGGLGLFPLLLSASPPFSPSFPDVQRKRSEKESEKGSGEFPNEERNHLWRAEGARILYVGSLSLLQEEDFGV
jgi:hypothetical protein